MASLSDYTSLFTGATVLQRVAGPFKDGANNPHDRVAAARHRSSPGLTRDQSIRKAAFLLFSHSIADGEATLPQLSSAEWRRLLAWLDINGLALYLLDRIDELAMGSRLPVEVINELRHRMADNTLRTHSLIKESVAIQEEFQSAGIGYAVLKGVSLCPSSVARAELRHQFDLDYLVAEGDAATARAILERRGYRLYAVSGKSWEFKANERPTHSIKDLYKASDGYVVELHLERAMESAMGKSDCRLNRVVHRELYGINMPVLAPVDLFLGQGLHAFKDVCSAFSRTAHLLEFYRHVLARKDDLQFWINLRAAALYDRRGSVGIGVVLYLLTTAFGPFAPAELSCWTVEKLPLRVRLWVEHYGRVTLFGAHPGTKLYLLLQGELEVAGLPARLATSRALLPGKLPPTVIRALPNEPLATRLARYRLQVAVVISRLKFHLIEGARYAFEAYRWRIYRERVPS